MTAAGFPPSVSDHSQIHIPFPSIADSDACHGAGDATAGSAESGTRTAGCHGGGGGGPGGLGGTGQPARDLGAGAAATVVVVDVVEGGGAVVDGDVVVLNRNDPAATAAEP